MKKLIKATILIQETLLEKTKKRLAKTEKIEHAKTKQKIMNLQAKLAGSEKVDQFAKIEAERQRWGL